VIDRRLSAAMTSSATDSRDVPLSRIGTLKASATNDTKQILAHGSPPAGKPPLGTTDLMTCSSPVNPQIQGRPVPTTA
jgi:hypothetical protein